MIPKDEIDRVCEECGLIHANGISRHGRCYHCGGELALVDLEELRLTAVTPRGIQIFENINTKTK
jgi:hypothetical protein